MASTPAGRRFSFTGLASTSWFVLQLLLFASVLVYVIVLYEVFSIYSGGPDQWTFGQFIAVMVWVPLGAKLLYSVLCKCNLPYLPFITCL